MLLNLDLAKKLTELGIRRVLVADDEPLNIDAAKSMVAKLPGIVFRFYRASSPVMDLLRENPPPVDLILTDLNMEREHVGFEILEGACRAGIPTIIVSSRYEPLAKTNQTVATPYLKNNVIFSSKSMSRTWLVAMNLYVEAAATPSNFWHELRNVQTSGGMDGALTARREAETQIQAALRPRT